MTLKRVYELPDPVHPPNMEHFAMLCCTNHSAISPVFHTYLFRESFLVENSIHAYKKPEQVFAKTHCTHCLNALPDHGPQIGQKHREIWRLSYFELKFRARSATRTIIATELRHQFGSIV